MEPGRSSYELQLDTLSIDNTALSGNVINADNHVHFAFVLTALTDGRFRVQMDEAVPTKPRFRVTETLQKNPDQEK